MLLYLVCVNKVNLLLKIIRGHKSVICRKAVYLVATTTVFNLFINRKASGYTNICLHLNKAQSQHSSINGSSDSYMTDVHTSRFGFRFKYVR